MRLIYLLLVAATTLPAICRAIVDSDKFSTVATSDSMQSIELQQLERGGKRYLRQENTAEEENENDDLSLLNEERNAALGKLQQSVSLPASFKNIKMPTSYYTLADDRPFAGEALNKSWLEFVKKLKGNPKALEIIRQNPRRDWSDEELKRVLNIRTGGWLTNSRGKMEALSWLRAYGKFVYPPKMNSLVLDKATTDLLRKVNRNSIAKKLADDFLENNWSEKKLLEMLKITSKTPEVSKEREALSLLLQLYAHAKLLAKPQVKDAQEGTRWTQRYLRKMKLELALLRLNAGAKRVIEKKI